LLALLPNLSVEKVTLLEPRTPHQSEKLKKVSKNEYGFTLSIFFVNEKACFITGCVFNRVQLIHNPMTGFGAAAPITFRAEPALDAALPRCLHARQGQIGRQTLLRDCEYRAIRLIGLPFS
jgi:hypothetical protein